MAPRIVTVAATQQSCTWDIEANVVIEHCADVSTGKHAHHCTQCAGHHMLSLQAKAEQHVRDAASRGANIILLQELFGTGGHVPYYGAPCLWSIAQEAHR